MKKIIALILVLMSSPAAAGVPCSVPFNLQNGTSADATQVMANYNALVACLGNAAAAGVNSDITALAALSTPIGRAQGGSSTYVGGPIIGANTLTLTVTPSNFSLVTGNQVTFFAAGPNTLSVTLNVNGTGPINVFRRTQLGVSAMVGGELNTGHSVVVTYDGTEYVCTSCGPFLVGEIRDFAGSTAPAGYLFIDGSCVSRTTYADLFSVIGTFFDPGGACDVAHFALPDGRGRMLAGQTNMGLNGTAARITSAGSGCDGTQIGLGCGAQNRTIANSNLPASIPYTDPGHQHGPGAGTLFASANGGATPAGTGATISGSFSLTASATTGITINPGSANTALTTLDPLQVVTKIIKF